MNWIFALLWAMALEGAASLPPPAADQFPSPAIGERVNKPLPGYVAQADCRDPYAALCTYATRSGSSYSLDDGIVVGRKVVAPRGRWDDQLPFDIKAGDRREAVTRKLSSLGISLEMPPEEKSKALESEIYTTKDGVPFYFIFEFSHNGQIKSVQSVYGEAL